MNNETTTTSNRNTTIGSVLIVAALGLAFFTYAHRPPQGFMDVLERADSWAFNPTAYYGLMFLSALLALAGVIRFLKSRSK